MSQYHAEIINMVNNNKNCKGCLIYETMPNKYNIVNMVAYCGLSRRSVCPCFYCLVKAMCSKACTSFRKWRNPHSAAITKHGGRFYT